MRSIRRYEIECDGKPHTFLLSYDPIFVSASPFRDQLYFWAEHDSATEEYPALLQVFPTGEAMPDRAMWLGSVIKGRIGEAWHLVLLPSVRSL